MKTNLAALLCGVIIGGQALLAAPGDSAAPLVEKFLQAGDLTGGEKALSEAIAKNPNDDGLHFQLGTLQFLRAVERLVQTIHGYGLNTHQNMLGMFDIRITPNPFPKAITYEDCRKIMENWLADLQKAEASLSKVKSPDVRMPLHFALIRLDFNGDQKADDDEVFWRIFSNMNPVSETTPEKANFVINFDLGDAIWLRGYCHLLMAIDEFALAHDFRDWFERTGHLIFQRVKSPYEFLQVGRKVFAMGDVDISDVVAFIHLLNFPVQDAKRTRLALEHLESMTRLSREMWKAVLAETDTAPGEWIPNPKQISVIPGGVVTEDMVKDWAIFLDEIDAILAGKTLIPFWRGEDDRGINLRKVLLEPRQFDLVLWVQGTAAAPYLEKGTVTSDATWQRLQRTFQGNFIAFAVWFN